MSDELRTKLQGLLGVRCVFPNHVEFSDGDFTVRCMLENAGPGKSLLYKESVEDVVVRLKSLSELPTDEQRTARFKVTAIVIQHFV